MNRESSQKDYYDDYYRKQGSNRNDLRTNRGVLFQSLALDASFIKACYHIELDPSSATVLDVGCGSGAGFRQLARLGYNLRNMTGIDAQYNRLSYGAENFPRASFIHGDATQMGLKDASFDLVTEGTVFTTIADDSVRRHMASEMIRVCRPGGYLLLMDWRVSKPWNRNYKALDKKELIELFSLGKKTTLVNISRGALVPPVGRFFSQYLPSAYFLVGAFFPILVGQVAYVLRRASR